MSATNEGNESALGAHVLAPPEARVEQLFQRYADDATLFRVLMCLWGVEHPLHAGADIAVPLGTDVSYVRKALLSLVMEGFVNARHCNGDTTYMLTHDPDSRFLAAQLLLHAVRRGILRDAPR